MLRESSTELKTYNFYEEFKNDYYIDAFDEHKWKVGRIKNIIRYANRNTIQVHFDGYSVRFDDVSIPPCRTTICPQRINLLRCAPTLSLIRGNLMSSPKETRER